MKTLLILLSIPLLMFAMGTAVQAAPIYNYYWGTDCTGSPAPANQDFDGPRVYQQVVSVQGLVYQTKGYEVVIHMGPSIPDYWNFLPDGCATQAGYDVTASTQGTAGCPAPLAPFPDSPSLTVEEILCKPGQMCSGYGVRLTNYYNEASFPQPSVAQLLGVLDWDLGSVGTCAGELDRLCFHVVSVGFLLNDGVTWDYQTVPSRDYATFNDPTNTLLCPLPVQASESTWGRVKSLYR